MRNLIRPVGQVLESDAERIAALKDFYPDVDKKDWREEVAGQRVQIINEDPIHAGILNADPWRRAYVIFACAWCGYSVHSGLSLDMC